MNAQRRGTNLKIDIRLALLALDRNPNMKLTGTIAQLEQQLREKAA